jgi:hypothetical protein
VIFSQRYHRALTEKRLKVVVPADARPKLSTCLESYNASVGVQRDPDDNWISNSSVVEEAILELMSEHGWDEIPGTNAIEGGEYYPAFKHLIRRGEAQVVFDFIELQSIGTLELSELPALSDLQIPFFVDDTEFKPKN